jgi:hypothetical protein
MPEPFTIALFIFGLKAAAFKTAAASNSIAYTTGPPALS